MNQKVIVVAGIFAVFFWIFLGGISIIPWQVAGVLVAVSIGIPTLLLRYEGGKSNVNINQKKTLEKHEEKENRELAPLEAQIMEEKSITGSPLLPDINELTKLRIDNDFIDKIYEEARSKAVNTYNDAQLSYFGIQASPFQCRPMVHIYFHFYSKWANKTCVFQYSDLTSGFRHYTPDKRARTDFEKKVFNNLPWKISPHFLQALNMAYDKIKPLPSVEGTWYVIYKSASDEYWNISFENGVNGETERFNWDGQGLDENSIKQLT